FRAGALLVAKEHGRAAVPRAYAADQRGVVRRQPIAVKLDEVRRQAADVVERVRPLRMACELDDFPDAHWGPRKIEIFGSIHEYISSRRASIGRSSVRHRTRRAYPWAGRTTVLGK